MLSRSLRKRKGEGQIGIEKERGGESSGDGEQRVNKSYSGMIAPVRKRTKLGVRSRLNCCKLFRVLSLPSKVEVFEDSVVSPLCGVPAERC
jgi:hypothetical protein